MITIEISYTTYPTASPVVIDDDVECIKILTDHGLLNAMMPGEGFNICFGRFYTDTHYGIASYQRGNARPEDNGYLVVLLPRSEISAIGASEFFAEFVADGVVGAMRWVEIKAETLENN